MSDLITIDTDNYAAMAKARSIDSQQQTTRKLETTRFLSFRRS